MIFNNTGFACTAIKYCIDEKLKFDRIISGMILPLKAVSDRVVNVTSACSKDKLVNSNATINLVGFYIQYKNRPNKICSGGFIIKSLCS